MLDLSFAYSAVPHRDTWFQIFPHYRHTFFSHFVRPKIVTFWWTPDLITTVKTNNNIPYINFNTFLLHCVECHLYLLVYIKEVESKYLPNTHSLKFIFHGDRNILGIPYPISSKNLKLFRSFLSIKPDLLPYTAKICIKCRYLSGNIGVW